MFNVLFIHPNFPAQYRLLAQALAGQQHVAVYALGDDAWMQATEVSGITLWRYSVDAQESDVLHPYIKGFEAGVRRGQAAIRFLLEKKHQGFEPDLIYVHPGWGDGLFLKDVFPSAYVVGYFEYYYRARGADVGFDSEFPLGFDDIFRVRLLNSIQHHALEGVDLGISPTAWQRSCYPSVYQPHLQVMHDGIDTERLVPKPDATLILPACTYQIGGRCVQSPAIEVAPGARIVTYVSRSLEPYRGIHSLMRALPQILANDADCRVVLVGKFEHSYGPPAPAQADSWFAHFLNQLGDQFTDQMLARIHVMGWVDYETYLRVLQVSTVHVYLTVPFILSWSVLEALSVGCLVVGSDTEPVANVITDGVTGLLVPFHDPQGLAAKVLWALNHPDEAQTIGTNARRLAIDKFDFKTKVLPWHLNLIDQHQPRFSF